MIPAAFKYAYLLFCVLSLALGAAPASAEELSHDEMVCTLDPQCAMPVINRRSRGITTTASVRDISERDGRGYYVFESISTNQRGEQVCRGTWTNIVRGV